MMNIDEILKHLPHRYPFLLIDRVLTIEPDKRIVAMKNVTINEPFFVGHFPYHPVMPGVLVIEAMAQAAAILTFRSNNHLPDDKSIYYFVGIDNARFKRPVIPGDQLIMEVTVLQRRAATAKLSAVARVGDAVVAEAELMTVMVERT